MSLATTLAVGAVLLAPASAPVSSARLAARLDRAIAGATAKEGLRHALFSMEVRALPSGRVLYSRMAETSLAPASSLKLATTAAALDAFGPDARFTTTLQSLLRPDAAGRLAGDLYLVGSGDPSLSRELVARPDFGAFELLADALFGAGVRHIEGKLVGCDGLFTGDRRGADWVWEDLVWWYGAEVSALTFADGSAHIKIIPGARAGDGATIERNPDVDHYQVDSKATTCVGDEVPGISLRRATGRNLIEVAGCLPVGWPPLERWVAIEDPARYATAVAARALEAKGISVGGIGTCAVPPEGTSVLAAYEGAPFSEILKDVNKPSHNLRAEMLLRLLGVRTAGEGSAEAGRRAVLAFLEAQHVGSDGWDVEDGSGLSRSDLVTARGLVELLVAMNAHRHGAVLRLSLPIAAEDGTLKRRFAGTLAAGRIVAKTGSLKHTGALAGYATPRRGEAVAFAILVNHATVPGGEIQDAIDSVAVLLAQ